MRLVVKRVVVLGALVMAIAGCGPHTQITLPSEFGWATGSFFSGGAPGKASTSITVEDLWSSKEQPGTATYYVDAQKGSDENPGDSPNKPLRTLRTAISKPKVGVIKARGTFYDGVGSSINTLVQNDIQIMAWGADRPLIRMGPDATKVTWVSDGNGVFSADISQSIYRVLDRTKPDGNNNFTDLKPVVSLSLVQAEPGSYWYDSGGKVIHVHMGSGGSPIKDSVLLRPQSAMYVTGNRAVYLKGVDVEGGTGIKMISTVDGSPRLYVYDSSFKYSGGNGIEASGASVYIEDSQLFSSDADNLNYHQKDGFQPKAIEIGLVSYDSGLRGHKGFIKTPETQNASSMHDSGSVIRINGKYGNSYGPVIPDTGSSSSLNIGTIALDSNATTPTRNVSFYSDGGMYLIDAMAKGSTYDLHAASGGALSVRGMVMAGSIVEQGSGTVQQF